MSASAAARSYELGAGPADRSRAYVPQEICPLSYTPWWRRLSPAQRLRYNQLQGLYFNEQLMFFEDALAKAVVEGALRAGVSPALEQNLRAFAWEEERHSEMFRRLNRLCEPRLYEGRDYLFVDVPAAAWGLIASVAGRPESWPFFIWVMLFQEERSVRYSKLILEQADCLEPHFVAAHRWHMADEAGHVRYDEELITRFWAPLGPLRRGLNARLLAWMTKEFFNTPRRACLRVIDRWTAEFPELAADAAAMKADLRGLETQLDFAATLYSRRFTPRSMELLDRHPELALMRGVLHAYESR